MLNRCPLLVVLLAGCLLAADQPPPAPYSLDFENLAPGDPFPDDVLVSGKFAVRQADGNNVLELPGEPLNAFSFLFGPSEHIAVDVTARIRASSTGRRFPEFGVGAGDSGGHKLWVMPGRNELAIRKGDQPAAVVPYEAWKSDTWTRLRLQVVAAGEGKWTVRGKVWADGAAEPKDWMVSFEDTEEPWAGRGSVWGTPYSGKPIWF